MLIWCTDEELSLMRYNSHTFVDSSDIVMVHDAGTQMFVPCVYSLIISRSEYMYPTVFHEPIVLTKYSWMPL
ncbi:hypothetical protein HZS_6905, partial [Henneguya salminicola]